MLVELFYVFFSLLLVIYVSRCYFRQRKSGLLYLASSLAFLALMMTLNLIDPLIWIYRIPVTVMQKRLIELCGLALFGCFTITAVKGIRKIFKA